MKLTMMPDLVTHATKLPLAAALGLVLERWRRGRLTLSPSGSWASYGQGSHGQFVSEIREVLARFGNAARVVVQAELDPNTQHVRVKFFNSSAMHRELVTPRDVEMVLRS